MESKGQGSGASPHGSKPSQGTNWIPLIYVQKDPAEAAQVPRVTCGPESEGSLLSLDGLPILCGWQKLLHSSLSPFQSLQAPRAEPGPWPAARWLLTLTHALALLLPSGAAT